MAEHHRPKYYHIYISRAIEPALHRISDTFPVLLVTGSQQVGKTTLLRHLAEPDNTLYPVEIRKSAQPGTQATKHFRVPSPAAGPEKFGGLSELKTDIGTGAVICIASGVLPLDAENRMVSVRII